MDILSTAGWSKEEIERAIADNEKKHPRFVEENKVLRENHHLIPHVDLNAALVSSCRSDILSCGRCRFMDELRRLK